MFQEYQWIFAFAKKLLFLAKSKCFLTSFLTKFYKGNNSPNALPHLILFEKPKCP